MYYMDTYIYSDYLVGDDTRMKDSPNTNTIVTDWNTAENAFLDYCKSKNLSTNTISYYYYRLNAFRQYLEINQVVETPLNLTPQTIRAFLISEAEKHTATTSQHSYSSLRSFYSWMELDGFIDRNPMLKVSKPKRRRTLIETFSNEQLVIMIDSCEPKTFIGIRDRAFLLLILDSAIRISELCSLKQADISWVDNRAKVVGKGDVERNVCFSATTAEALRLYVARRNSQKVGHDFLFVSIAGKAMGRNALTIIMRDRCTKAGITGVRCTPHTLRHTAAVNFIRNGGNAFELQKLLGHTTLEMTKKYVNLADTDLRKAHNIASPVENIAGLKLRPMKTRYK